MRCLQELGERLARQLLDQVALHVDRRRCSASARPAGAAAGSCASLSIIACSGCVAIEHVDVRVHLVDRGAAEHAVGEAAGVRHQLAHRHRVIRRDLRDRAVLRIHFRDLEVRELGNVLRHRIVELPLAFLEQHHHRDAGDRLGHRVDAEDRVLLHRRAALQVALAGGLELHDLAVLRDHRDDAGRAGCGRRAPASRS